MNQSSDRPSLLFFGRAKAGKTELVQVFQKVLTSSGKPLSVSLTDTDSDADSVLLARPEQLEQIESPAPLVRSIHAADALIVAIDCSVDRDEVREAYRAIRRLLERFEEGRIYGREVTGLPIILTLTKCDKLLERGDTVADWQRRIDERAGELIAIFEEYLTESLPAFGSLNVFTAAVSLRPPALAGIPLDAAGTFGAESLVRSAVTAAADFFERRHRSRRELSKTAAGAVGMIACMAASLLGAIFLGGGPPDDQLVARVRTYQSREGSGVLRYSSQRRPGLVKDLSAIHADPGFGQLPADLRQFVEERLAEFERYRQYREKFDPPRLSPADVRSAAELDRIEQDLLTVLSLPPEDAAAWAGTEADQLREKWWTDLRLLRSAEGRIHDWYRGTIRRATDLLFVALPDRVWRGEIDQLLRDADRPPVTPNDPIPGSVTVPGPRGAALTYAPAFECDRVEFARRDWAATRDRLLRQRDLADVLGMTGATRGDRLLDLSDVPTAAEAWKPFARSRLDQIQTVFPGLMEAPTAYAVRTLPDPCREELRNRLLRSLDQAVRPIRESIRMAVLAAGDGKESVAAWQTFSGRQLNEPWLVEWSRLVLLLLQLTSDAAVDPRDELRQFVSRSSWDAPIEFLDVSIPHDLTQSRVVPADSLTLKVGEVSLAYRRSGEVRSDATGQTVRFLHDRTQPKPVFRPDVAITMTLDVRIGPETGTLVWNRSRSAVFGWDALVREPNLVRNPGGEERATGVRVRIMPDGAFPALPLFFPDLSKSP